MRRKIQRIIFYLFISLSPLLYFLVKKYIPAYESKPQLYDIFFLLPYILFIISAFLGIRLNQTRIFFTALLWITSYLFLNQTGIAFLPAMNLNIFAQSFSVMAPLTVLLIFLFQEGYILGIYGLIRFALVLISLFLCILAASYPSGLIERILTVHPIIEMECWNLPDYNWLLLAGLASFFILKPNKTIMVFKTAVLISIIPLFLALNVSAAATVINIETQTFNAVSYSIMGIVFLYSIHKLYWHKVYIDELTGVPNRRSFDEHLRKLGRRYTIAMIDIDHFKKFNDKYGHAEGDNVLRYAAQYLYEESGSRIYRYGGEEFAAIFRGMEIEDVFWHVDRMREKLAKMNFYIRMPETIRRKKSLEDRGKKEITTKKVHVTVSIGIAQRTMVCKTQKSVIEAADKALYRAKKKGRNQCVKAKA